MYTYKFKKNTVHISSGFTLIETLVAIFILVLATTGPLSFAQSGLRASFVARDQVVAFYLAQDAIETIKNLRDNYALKNEGVVTSYHWLDGLGDCYTDGGVAVCDIDSETLNPNAITRVCSGQECPPLRYDSNTRTFTNDSNDSISRYTRTVYVSEIKPNVEAQVVVKVSWDSNFFGVKHIVAQENIYNFVRRYSN